MKEERPYDGRMHGEHVDVFTGPAIPLAIEHAATVQPGKLRLTTFTAWDSGELMGLNGRSLIVKLPESAPENCRPYWGQQWYMAGSPQGAIEYSPNYIPQYVEATRCWLVDLAIQNNWFADKPDREAVLFERLKSLDTGHWMRSGGQRLRPPDGYADDDSHIFTFDVVHDLDVEVGKDLPLGIWYAHVKGSRVLPGILDRAHSAPCACVMYLRFQLDNPTPEEDRTTR